MPSTPPAPLLAQTFLYASFMFLLSSILSNNSDMLCVLRSFPLPAVTPMLCVYDSFTFRLHPLSDIHRYIHSSARLHCSALWLISAAFRDCLLWLLLTSRDKSFSTAGGILQPILASVRPRGISPCSFLVYPPDLRLWVTATFRASLSIVSLPTINALLSGFYP